MDVCGFVRKTGAIYQVALKLLHFSIGSTFGVKYDLILALGSQTFEKNWREIFFRHAVEYLESACSDQKRLISTEILDCY